MAEFFKDMDITEYHDRTDVLSKTMLSVFADCPARFKYLYIDGGVKKTTKSLRVGNAMHTLALEPELWKAGYHIMPATYQNEKGEKKKWQNRSNMRVYQDQMELAGYILEHDDLGEIEFKPTKKSKVILSQSEYKSIEGMANALAKDPYALSLLKVPGYVESSIFWTEGEGEDEIALRCRPDFLWNDPGLHVDLKMANTVEPKKFWKDAFNFKYFLSVALSCRGYEALRGTMPDNYIFLTVEPEPPYIIECFESFLPIDEMLDITYFDYGNAALEKILEQYRQCRKSGVWPKYQKGIGKMSLPDWEIKNYIQKGI